MTARRRRGRVWAWRAVALVPAFLIASFLANGSVPDAIRLEALAVLLVTLARPPLGLMLVALLAPLGDAVVPFLGSLPARHAETLVIAFLAGWLSALGTDEERPPLPAGLVNAIWVFGGVLIASVAATALQLGSESPAELQKTLASLIHSYLLTDDVIGAHTAAQLLEGLGLLGAAGLIARRPRDRAWLRLSVVASGLIASVASGLLGLHVAPLRTLSRHAFIGKRRFSAITGDVNAAGSSYLLYVGVAAGIAAMVRTRRRVWLSVVVIILAGLAITTSAAAAAACMIVLGAGAIRWMGDTPPRRWKIAGALALAAVVAGAIAFARSDRSMQSVEMRGGFTQASLRLIEARPVLGIGAGRYYPLSLLVLPNRLSWVYGRENAHDYFLQIAAELGVGGAVAFVWVLGAALLVPLTRAWKGRADGMTVGCVAGASAYLVTALAGHPFLVPETVIPFWIVLGLLVGERADPIVQTAWRRRAAIGVACVLLATAWLRPGVPAVRLPPTDDGFGPWRTDDVGGQLFHQAGAQASLFVGPTVKSVEIPLRLESADRLSSATIVVGVPGWFRGDQRVGPDWSTMLVPLSGSELLMPRQRINLAVASVQSGTTPREQLRLDVGQIRILTAQ